MNLPHSSRHVWPLMTIDNTVVAHCLVGHRLTETTFYDLFAKVRELRETAGSRVPFLEYAVTDSLNRSVEIILCTQTLGTFKQQLQISVSNE